MKPFLGNQIPKCLNFLQSTCLSSLFEANEYIFQTFAVYIHKSKLMCIDENYKEAHFLLPCKHVQHTLQVYTF